jgi:hypothetical protein
MDEQPYPSEDLLQTPLEKYPDISAGEQINEANLRRPIHFIGTNGYFICANT